MEREVEEVCTLEMLAGANAVATDAMARKRVVVLNFILG